MKIGHLKKSKKKIVTYLLGMIKKIYFLVAIRYFYVYSIDTWHGENKFWVSYFLRIEGEILFQFFNILKRERKSKEPSNHSLSFYLDPIYVKICLIFQLL
jgi:hypothetical protein